MSIATPAPAAHEETFWLTRFTRPIFFFAAILTLAGIYLRLQVPISVFPETNFPRVVIGVDNGVMPVEQMEVTITRPIEDAVNSVPGLATVRSTTSRGSAEVSLFFDWNVDMYRDAAADRCSAEQGGADAAPTARITTNRLTFATFPILGYSLTSDTIPQTQLWETRHLRSEAAAEPRARRQHRDGAGRPGARVSRRSQPGAACSATASPLPISSMPFRLRTSSTRRDSTKPIISSSWASWARRCTMPSSFASSWSRPRQPARRCASPMWPRSSRHAARLHHRHRQRQDMRCCSTSLGSPRRNTVAVADAVDARDRATCARSFPPGVKLEPFYDQSQLVRDSIASVRDAIFIGLVLACIILFLFLRDWTSSLIAGLVIPVTVAVTILVLWAIGQSFNLMTLGGLAAAIGLVIDDAIVVVENIVMHRDNGEPRASAVRKALSEITVPLIGSTITPVVVFLPLISVTGVTGSFFRALAITMAAALLTSLMLALTWTPA